MQNDKTCFRCGKPEIYAAIKTDKVGKRDYCADCYDVIEDILDLETCMGCDTGYPVKDIVEWPHCGDNTRPYICEECLDKIYHNLKDKFDKQN